MRILHIVPTYYPALQFGGTITVTHDVNKSLVRKGHDITVFTTMDGQDSSKIIPNLETIVDGVKIIYFNSYFQKKGYGISPKFVYHLFRKIYLYDIIHMTSVFTFTSFFSPLIALMNKKPYIISSHGTLDPNMVLAKSTFIKKISLFVYERYYLNHASAIHVLVDDEKDWLVELNIHNKKIIKIPNGIECINRLKPNEERRGLYLLYLGRLNYKKNIDLIIEVFADLKKDYPFIHLNIAGPDDGSEYELRQLARNFDVDSEINFLGLVKGNEKEKLLLNSDIFLLPSKNEGLSMAQLEAMCYGCAVVVGNRGGIHHELKQHDAGLVIEPSIETLKSAIQKLIDNPTLLKQIKQNGHRLVLEEFQYDKVIDAYIKMYEKLK